ncbi:DUF2303 family protein [Rhodovulum sulfidophilum]|uniref:DUF2303 family protein n=2 Tax=Rhodovulum sulfidophilum TaxID=35806 RepID=UPI0019289596|nr:DUF2303 family protein [Rhodovulum sulfidophilum]MBL3587772.1 DUF2303 family protein [Rhodovulum sulfidophilum]
MADLTEIEALKHLAEAAAAVPNKIDGFEPFMAIPNGQHIESLDAYRENPARIRHSTTFRDVASLAAYLDRFADDHSLAFSDPDAATIKCVLDYHEGGEPAAIRPRWGEHVAAFRAIKSPQYEAWAAKHGQWIGQKAAGEFLEERAVDLAEPDPATLMDMVMQFDALRKVNFKQSQKLQNGTVQFIYTTEDEVRGAVAIPERVTLLVPVFEGMEPDRIPVRLKYRIDEARLTFSFEIHDKQQVERTAFERCEHALGAAHPIPQMRVA